MSNHLRIHHRVAAVPLVVAGLSIVASSGCSSDTSGDARERTAGVSQGIHGFGSSPTPDTKFPAVGGTSADLGAGGCTATLISPTVALTAAHCYSLFAQNCLVASQHAGAIGDFVLYPGGTVGVDPANLFKVDGIAIAPGAYNQRLGDCDALNHNNNQCNAADPQTGVQTGFDVALLHLSQPLTSVTPMTVVTSLSDGFPQPYSLHVSMNFAAALQSPHPLSATLVGVGQSDDTGSDPPRLAANGVFRKLGNFWDVQCNTPFSCSNVPDTTPQGSCQAGSYEASTLTIGRTTTIQNFDGPIIGKGDSGGPLLVQGGVEAGRIAALPEGQYAIVGVASSTTSPNVGSGRTVPPGDYLSFYSTTYGPEIGPWIDAHLSDFDGDGVPDTTDNCTVTWNQDQANCNQTAEAAALARGDTTTPLLGDACDPVPCPGANADAVTSTGGATVLTGGPPLQFVQQRTIHDSIQFQTVGSAPQTAVGLTQFPQPTSDPTQNTSLPIAGVDTAFRFCQQAPSLGFRCLDPQSVRDVLLTVDSSADTEGFSPARPWHRVSMGFLGTRGADSTLGYGSPNAALQWGYASDNAFWHRFPATPVIPNPDPGQYDACTAGGLLVGTCVDGYFWVHGNTDIGYLTTSVNGTHVGTHGPGLSNHYFPIRPDAIATWAIPTFSEPVIPAPPQNPPDPPPYLLWRPNPGDPIDQLNTRLIGLINRALPVLSKPGLAIAVAPIGGIDVTTLFSPGLIATLGSGAHWVSASEASPFVGNGIHAIRLSTDGTRILDTALVGVWKVSLGSELLEGGGLATSPVVPVARSGYASIFSRTESTAYIIGGTDSTGHPLADVWAQKIGQPWRQVGLAGGTLGQVLAAGYAGNDAHIWLVDHVVSGIFDTLRLVRLDPHTGAVQVLTQAPRLDPTDRFWFVSDRDGGIILAKSSPLLNTHVLAKIALRGLQLQVCPLEIAPGQLATAPFADQAGYTLPMVSVIGNISLVRRDSLETSLLWQLLDLLTIEDE